jgi:hypothetical protein
MNDKQLAALVKKTVAKAEKAKKKARPKYDATLEATGSATADQSTEDLERADFFAEMKKREF